jgi:hypothetical protein
MWFSHCSITSITSVTPARQGRPALRLLEQSWHVDTVPGGGGTVRNEASSRLVGGGSAPAGRAISVPLTPVIKGVSRSLAVGSRRRSGCVSAQTVQIPKLTVRVRFPSSAPSVHHEEGRQFVRQRQQAPSGERWIATTSPSAGYGESERD